MNQEMMTALRELAAKLGTTTEYLWGVLIRQAYIHGLTGLFLYALLGLACFFWWKSAVRWASSEKDPYSEMELAYIFTGVGLAILVVLALIYMGEVLTAFISPEYWALKQVLGAL